MAKERQDLNVTIQKYPANFWLYNQVLSKKTDNYVTKQDNYVTIASQVFSLLYFCVWP